MDTSFTASTNGAVSCVAVQTDGKLLVGGSFTSVNSSPVSVTTGINHIARLNSDGSLDTAFDSSGGVSLGGANDEVFGILIQPDGKLVICGKFTSVNGSAVNSATGLNHIARLNANGTLDTSFDVANGVGLGGTNGYIFSVAIQADSKLVIGGDFTSVNGSAANRVARLNPDGTLDIAFNTGGGASLGVANANVYCLMVQPDGKIVIGGNFTIVNGSPASLIARLNSDGTRDTGFSATLGPAGLVLSMVLQSDGKLLLGGSFDSVNGSTVNNIARLNGDGTRDSVFNTSSGGVGLGGTIGTIYSLAIQPDGKLLLGGTFSKVNDTFRASRCAIDQ